MDSTTLGKEQNSRRNHQRMLPPIILPTVILALIAAFASPSAAMEDFLTPKISTPVSLLPTSNHPNTQMIIPTPVTVPPTERISERFEKRYGSSENSSTEASQSMETRPDTSTTRSEETSTSTASTSASPLPSPFDNPVPNAFQVPGSDDSCPKFMAGLLSDPAFKSCYPISMLSETSTSFFDAQKQLVSIVRVLDATCAADVTKCSNYMTKAAQALMSNANCRKEFEGNQTQVVQAWRGLTAYNVLYSSTCLQNPSSNSYCFANAVTNLSNPSDSYMYFMPFGLPLISTSTPSCNWCVQNTMFIYHSASANRGQPVASVYRDAANQVNTLCGPYFVNSTLPAAENGAFTTLVPSHISMAANTLFMLVLFAWFL